MGEESKRLRATRAHTARPMPVVISYATNHSHKSNLRFESLLCKSTCGIKREELTLTY